LKAAGVDNISPRGEAKCGPSMSVLRENLMSIFDDLSIEYKAWRTRYIEEERTSIMFAHRFANGFKTHIGAPDFFKEPDDEGGAPKPYVKAMKLIDRGDDTHEPLEPDGIFDVIHRGQDGYWWFAIRVALEIAPRTWPKQGFCIPIHFIIGDDGLCKMRITNQVGGEFDFDISNVANYAKAYKFIVSLLLDILHAKPSDQVQEKQPIGFLFPSAPNVETEIAAFEGLGKPST
jgi:hypothetical protein